MSIETRQIFAPESDDKGESIEQSRPKELFQVNKETTTLICCNEGEITSVALTLACRNSGQQEVSCLAGGITGIVHYLNHIISVEDRIRLFDPVETKRSELNSKLEERVKLDTDLSASSYYNEIFIRNSSIKHLIMVLHNSDEAMRLRTSKFIEYLREMFSHVHLCADTRDVMDLLKLSKEEVLKARQVLKPEKILDTRINEHKQLPRRGYNPGKGYNYEGD